MHFTISAFFPPFPPSAPHASPFPVLLSCSYLHSSLLSHSSPLTPLFLTFSPNTFLCSPHAHSLPLPFSCTPFPNALALSAPVPCPTPRFLSSVSMQVLVRLSPLHSAVVHPTRPSLLPFVYTQSGLLSLALLLDLPRLESHRDLLRFPDLVIAEIPTLNTWEKRAAGGGKYYHYCLKWKQTHQHRAAELFQLWPFLREARSAVHLILQYQCGHGSSRSRYYLERWSVVSCQHPIFFYFPYSSLFLSGLAHPELVSSSTQVFHSKSAYYSHQSSLPTNPGFSHSSCLLKNSIFCSWASFRNQVMLCICLADLLSPFILLQLLSQLSSLFPSLPTCVIHTPCFSTWLGVAVLPPLFFISSGGGVSSANTDTELVNLTGSSRCSPELVRSLWLSNAHSLECCILRSQINGQQPLLCDSWVCDLLPAQLLF